MSISGAAQAQTGYEIKVKMSNFDKDKLFLGYHLADKQYVKDTTTKGPDGYFTFSGKEPLKGGIYLIIMPPDNKYIQVAVDQEQKFSMEIDALEPNNKTRIKGNAEAIRFQEYFADMNRIGEEIGKLKSAQDSTFSEEEREALQKKLNVKLAEVDEYKRKFYNKYPNTLTGRVAIATVDVKAPDFTGPEDSVNLKKYYFYKNHWFDNIHMEDDRLLRTPVLYTRVDHYLEKMTVQVPDSVEKSVDEVLRRLEKSDESYKFFLSHLLNKYFKSNIVGFDEVFVHIAENYYATGKAPWVEKEQMDKIMERAHALKPVLVGRQAPPLNQLMRPDSSLVNLYDIKSEYLVLVFWAPDCGHCQKSMPKLHEEYPRLKAKGVEIVSFCNQVYDKVKTCWEFTEKEKMNDWINVCDPVMRTRYKQLYDVQTTPKIYVLDKDKKIISKGIAVEQLEEVMGQIIEMKKKEMERSTK